jgi:hypothetical protein
MLPFTFRRGEASVGLRWILRSAKLTILGFVLTGTVHAGGSEGLECNLFKTEPRLDYEFRLAALHRVRIRAAQLAGDGSVLKLKTTVHAVKPRSEEPVITIERIYRRPPVPERTEEWYEFRNALAFGEGVYEAEWSLEAEDGRSCRLEWTIEAKRDKKLRELPSPLLPGKAVDIAAVMYRAEDSVIGAERPLRVKVFLNLDSPQRRRGVRGGQPGGGRPGGGRGVGGRGGGGGRGGVGGRGGGGGLGGGRGRRPRSGGGVARRDVRRVSLGYRIGVLRSLSRDPRVGEVALVAYSVEDQKTLLRHGDFPSLRHVSEELSPNTVELDDLAPESDNVFFGDMLVREMVEDEAADLHVFLGPEAQFGEKAPSESLQEIGKALASVFYLNSARRASWSGLIESSVKALGGKEIEVHSPEDLWKAMRKMLGPADRR